jgi:hypothetical protein
VTGYTYATLALESGANIVFVSKQLGHHSPAFTLQVYGHALPSESPDMGFADFSTPDVREPDRTGHEGQTAGPSPNRGSKRLNTALSVADQEIQRISAIR